MSRSISTARSLPAAAGSDRDRGEPRGSAPPIPPYIRIRIRRFGGLSRAVGCGCRRAGFGPFGDGAWGFTPHLRPEGQLELVFHRLVRTRSPSFLPPPPFGPSVIAPPTMPSADFCAAIAGLATRSVRGTGHGTDLPR